MTLSPNERALLLALKNGRHFKGNAGKASDLLGLQPQDANPAGRRLVALRYAMRVPDSERPGVLLLRITDAGVSEAEKILEAQRKPTLRERLKALPIGKGAWEVVKLALAAFAGALAKSYFG